MRFLIPQGIGDAMWNLMKAQDVARQLGDGVVDVCLNYSVLTAAECRAIEFAGRFDFVRNVEMYPASILKPGPPTGEDGIPRYRDDGPPDDLPGIDYVLCANGALDRGTRLEAWLPQFAINWNAIDAFRFRFDELAAADELGHGYALFFMGSEQANTTDGHNRGGIWTPQEWADLGRWSIDNGSPVVVVGGADDVSYFDKCVRPLLGDAEPHWRSLIGRTGIGATFAIARRARFVISYQSGIGIVSHYMGVPTGIFWRQHGDSISSSFYITSDSRMASAWASPRHDAAGKHLPLFYGRHGVERVKDEIWRRGW